MNNFYHTWESYVACLRHPGYQNGKLGWCAFIVRKNVKRWRLQKNINACICQDKIATFNYLPLRRERLGKSISQWCKGIAVWPTHCRDCRALKVGWNFSLMKQGRKLGKLVGVHYQKCKWGTFKRDSLWAHGSAIARNCRDIFVGDTKTCVPCLLCAVADNLGLQSLVKPFGW